MDNWIFKTSQGDTAHQRADGSFYLQHADGTTKPLSEFELKRFITSVLERGAIEDAVNEFETALGFQVPKNSRQEMIDRAHRRAREEGLLRTGSLALSVLSDRNGQD